ncbi:MAG: hypothetical protein V2A73_08530 [Pseudomonadota bacterium]
MAPRGTNGRETFRIEDNGAVFAASFDGADRRTSETIPVVDNSASTPTPTTCRFSYDGNGNRIRRVETHANPEGDEAPVIVATAYVFDALDREVRRTTADGHTFYSEYDSRDRLIASYDSRAPRIADPLNPSGQINDRGNATRRFYDGAGRLWLQIEEISTNGEGGSQLDTANPFNADGTVTRLTVHDANGRIVARVDDNGSGTTFGYDVLDRQTVQVNADGGRRTYVYDRDSHPIQLVDENNTVHTLAYDGTDRLTAHTITGDPSRKVAGGFPLIVGTTVQTFEYDGMGRITKAFDNNDPLATDDDALVAIVYDSRGRVIEEAQNGKAVSSSYLAANRSRLHYPDGGRVLSLAHDAVGQLVEVSDDESSRRGIGLRRWLAREAILTAVLGVLCPCWRSARITL